MSKRTLHAFAFLNQFGLRIVGLHYLHGAPLQIQAVSQHPEDRINFQRIFNTLKFKFLRNAIVQLKDLTKTSLQHQIFLHARLAIIHYETRLLYQVQ